MNTFERVSQIEGKNRTDMLEIVLKNQEVAQKRLRNLELKVAFAAGAVVLGEFLVKMLIK